MKKLTTEEGDPPAAVGRRAPILSRARGSFTEDLVGALVPSALLLVAVVALASMLPGVWIDRVLDSVQAAAAVIATVLAVRALRDSAHTAQILEDTRKLAAESAAAEREAATRLAQAAASLDRIAADSRTSQTGRIRTHGQALAETVELYLDVALPPGYSDPVGQLLGGGLERMKTSASALATATEGLGPLIAEKGDSCKVAIENAASYLEHFRENADRMKWESVRESLEIALVGVLESLVELARLIGDDGEIATPRRLQILARMGK